MWETFGNTANTLSYLTLFDPLSISRLNRLARLESKGSYLAVKKCDFLVPRHITIAQEGKMQEKNNESVLMH